MLNRTALIVRYKQPFVDWINAADRYRGFDITLEDANSERTVYLIQELSSPADLPGWLELNYDLLWQEELEGWYPDPSLWPQQRSRALFDEWCNVEVHTMVIDRGLDPLEDDEA